MTENSVDELAEAMRNSLERGISVEKLKLSFINAGYNVQSIEKAIQMVQLLPQTQAPPAPAPSQPPQILKPVKLQPRQIQPEQKIEIQKLQIEPMQIQKKPNFWIMILIIVSVLILAGSALLGLYWDSIF